MIRYIINEKKETLYYSIVSILYNVKERLVAYEEEKQSKGERLSKQDGKFFYQSSLHPPPLPGGN